jgi:hypothetical protein
MSKSQNMRKRKRDADADADAFMNEISDILLNTNTTSDDQTSDLLSYLDDLFPDEDELPFECSELLFDDIPDYTTYDDKILEWIKLTIPVSETDVSQTRKCPYCDYFIFDTEDNEKLINHIVEHLNKINNNTSEYKPKAVKNADKIKVDPEVIIPLRNTKSFEQMWQESFSALKEYMSDESNLPEKLSPKSKRWFREQIENYENNMNTMNIERYPKRRSDWADFMKTDSYEKLMNSKNRKWR